VTDADRQAFAVYQQLYLLRCLYIIRFYRFAQAYGQRNSLEKESGTDAGLLSEIAPTEKDPTGHNVVLNYLERSQRKSPLSVINCAAQVIRQIQFLFRGFQN
jgi:hypothetical protein